jgi:hypothetical protein
MKQKIVPAARPCSPANPEIFFAANAMKSNSAQKKAPLLKTGTMIVFAATVYRS